MHKNIPLVVGITILFLGLAIQPSIAVNPISPDYKEDCNICPTVSKTHLVRLKSLLNRFEAFNNKLSVMSKLNPEVADRYQELFDRITTLSKLNNELDSDRDCPIICTILKIISVPNVIFALIFMSVEDFHTIGELILFDIMLPFYPFFAISFLIKYTIGVYFYCWEFPDIWPW